MRITGPPATEAPVTVAVPLGDDTSFCPALVTTIGIMLRPEVRYARAEDGVAIAYSVVGDGPITIVVVSPLISQLELAWEEPELEHFWSRFAACARLVLFDRRSAGLSDPSPAGERVELAALALDIKAVLDACDVLDRAVGGGAMRAALRRDDRKNAAGTGRDALTPAERDVAALIAAGMTNSQAATWLRIAPHTVDGRLRRVRQARCPYPGRADRRVRARDRLSPGPSAGCREIVRDHVCRRPGAHE
jgi:DNA-binding CsgD family transcriptional regulator